jgi:hypothetical protein
MATLAHHVFLTESFRSAWCPIRRGKMLYWDIENDNQRPWPTNTAHIAASLAYKAPTTTRAKTGLMT